MAKKSYVIDVTKTVFPFGQEYWPNKAEPVSQGSAGLTDNIAAVDMKNVLPTPFGHTSFFGTTPLGGLKLPPMTERVFTYKDSLNNNTMIALGGYGAMFTNDGITWNISEVPLQLAQTAVGKYEFQPDMSINYTGFASATAAFTKAAIPNTPPMGTDNNFTISGATITHEVQVLPINTAGQFMQASKRDLVLDPVEVFDPLSLYINPGIVNVASQVGDTYVMSHALDWTEYTVQVGDTDVDVIQSLVGDLDSKFISGNRGLIITYISNTRLKVEVTSSSYTSTYLEYLTVFKIPSVDPALGALLGTITADHVPLQIPHASVGNLLQVVFNSTLPLTDGSFAFRRGGNYDNGGTHSNTVGVVLSRTGDVGFDDINLLLGKQHIIPATESILAIRRLNGATPVDMTASIYDSGIPILSSILGSKSTRSYNRISCNLVPADIIVGRVLILQSLGQIASYTIVVGDTISTAISALVFNYNTVPGGISVATHKGTQWVQATRGALADNKLTELFFQAAPLATMTENTTSVEIVHTKNNYGLGNTFVALSEFYKLYSLVLINTTPSVNTVYQIQCDGRPVPVTSPLGAWSDSNYNFTSAQVTAASLAGTKLFVRLTGKHLTVLASDGSGNGTGIVGHVDFKFRTSLIGAMLPSTHTGGLTSLVNIGAAAGEITELYIKDLVLGTMKRLPDVYQGTVSQAAVSLYNEAAVGVSSINSGARLPSVGTSDTFKFLLPLDFNGKYTGYLVDLEDSITPNTVVVTVTNPETQAPIVSTVLSLAFSSFKYSGIVGLTVAGRDTLRTHNPWTIAIIKNRLYCYRNGQGVGTYILRLLADGTAWEQLTPTFANMAQIEGITSARGRMVMWDTTGSVYTSSVTDPVDFTPSLKTQANVAKVDAVRGNIVLCLGYKDGYIIYSTASIILATYQGGTQAFKYTTLSNEQGILNTKAVAIVDDTLQFAYTQAGLYAVSAQGIQDVSPDASAYLKSSALSPRLDYLENRYLSISFAPETPSWIVSKEEAYSGATIGVPAIPYLPTLSLAPTGWNFPDTSLYTVSVQLFVSFTIPAHNGTYAVDSGNGDIYPGASIHSFSEPSYSITGLQDLKNWINRTSPIPSGGMFVPNGADIPGPADLEVWQIDGSVYFVDIQAQISGWGYMSYIGLTDIYDTPDGSYVFPASGLIASQAIQIAAKDFPGLSRFILQNDIELAMIYNIVSAGYSLGNLGQLSSASNSLLAIKGTLYSWGYVYLNYPSGATIVDGNGNPANQSVTMSSTPQVIGNSPIQILVALINTIGQPIPILPTKSIPTIGLPTLAIPGGSFITTQGTAEPIDPIYSRALILDTQLKNWGSCDVPFRTLIDFIPLNERSLNPITQGAITTKFTYQNLAKAFAIMKQDGTLNLCTQDTTDSVMEFGDIGFTNTGVTRFLGALASFATETGTVLEVLGSRDGERLHPLFTASSTSTNGAARLYTVLTGKWFRLRITGRFDLKQLTFDGELGGTR